MSKLTICGGGNAAHALLALACGAGWDVDLYAPHANEAGRLNAALQANNGLVARFADGRQLRGYAHRVSAHPADVIPGSALILLALPAFAHGSTLNQVTPYLDSDATIGVLPARSGFDYQLRALYPYRRVPYTFFGLQSLPWACRITAYGQEVEILGTKAGVDIAAWPAQKTPDLARQLQPLFGVNLRPVSSFLALTLANTGQLIHPGIMYGLCAGHENATYSGGDAPLFYQGVDEHTAARLQAMSDDVQALAATLEERIPHFDAAEVIALHCWLLQAYPNDVQDGGTLRAAFNSNRAYSGLRLPLRPLQNNAYAVDFTARYLNEDIPFGLVVLRGIAQLAGAETPAIDEVINWAQVRLGQRYLVDGALCGPDVPRARAPQSYGITSIAELRDWNVVTHA